MEKALKKVDQLCIERTLGQLNKNNFEAHYVESAPEALRFVLSKLNKEQQIAFGGSITLDQIDLIETLRREHYHLIDRYAPQLSRSEIAQTFLDAFSSDVYLSSVNAITERGELYCVDGRSNRIAALLYGPKRVIIVAGYQKIVPFLCDAVERVKRVAAPENVARLNIEAPCKETGLCAKAFCDERHLMAIAPELCPQGICSNAIIMGRQSIPNRVMVVIVGEQLGY